MTDADDDDDENMGTLLIALMQKGRRKKRKEGLDMLTIGYAVYKVRQNTHSALERMAEQALPSVV